MAAARFKLPSNAWTKRLIGFAIKLNTIGSVSTIAGFGSDATSAQSFIAPASISVQTTAPYLRLNTTPFSESVSLGDWNYVELLVDRTALTVTAYLNGEQAAQTTITSGQANDMGRFAFEVLATAANHNFDIDDWYYLDDVGEEADIEPIGMCKVDLMPVASVVDAQFTPEPEGTSTPEALATPLDPSTFVATLMPGARDILSHGFVGEGPAAIDEVLLVQTTTVVELTEYMSQITTAAGFGGPMATVTETLQGGGIGVVRNTITKNPSTNVPINVPDLANLKTGYATGLEWPTE